MCLKDVSHEIHDPIIESVIKKSVIKCVFLAFLKGKKKKSEVA